MVLLAFPACAAATPRAAPLSAPRLAQPSGRRLGVAAVAKTLEYRDLLRPGAGPRGGPPPPPGPPPAATMRMKEVHPRGRGVPAGVAPPLPRRQTPPLARRG